MKPSIDFPSGEIVDVVRTSTDTVQVTLLRRRWWQLARRREHASFRWNARTERWFWADSNLELVLAPNHVWTSLAQALTDEPANLSPVKQFE